jgi:thioesterase domain-containing protein
MLTLLLTTTATTAINTTQECGKLLADVLLSRPQGTRPVTLLGYSLGARAIFYALEALAAAGERGQGIVENAVLLGAPLGTATKRWKRVRSVVAGRLVNGYSTRDFVLSLVYRSVLCCPVDILS